MRVTVVFNRQRQTLDEVEALTYDNFVQAVAAIFGLNASDFDILLGENVLNLETNAYLSDFGVISGDLLHVRLKTPSAPTPHAASPHNNTRTSAVAAGVSASSSSTAAAAVEITCASSSALSTGAKTPFADGEAMEEFVIERVERFMHSAGFVQEDKRLFPGTTPTTVVFKYSHVDAPKSCAEITMNLFRDGGCEKSNDTEPIAPSRSLANENDKMEMTEDENKPDNEDERLNQSVTSIYLLPMVVFAGGRRRCFLLSTFVEREFDHESVTARLDDDVLVPLKEGVLGPDNPFLRMLAKNLVLDRLFHYLAPKDVLGLERTCKYAQWKCRSSKRIDDLVWKRYLREKFGANAVPAQLAQPSTSSAAPDDPTTTTAIAAATTYRELCRQKAAEARRVSPSRFGIFRPADEFFPPPMARTPWWPSPLYPHQQPLNNPRNNPDVNPFSPYSGGLIMPSRPQQRPPEWPRIYPTQPYNWPDPLAPDGPPDPDMPQGPRRGGFEPGGGPFGPPRRGGGPGGWPPPSFGGGFIG